ncbi:unnamed protein product [Amoebophrya sp. A120]|nr:unnamed protein product [Amoebophrya sp. A120]|eukprot:GSA120T00002037001.1
MEPVLTESGSLSRGSNPLLFLAQTPGSTTSGAAEAQKVFGQINVACALLSACVVFLYRIGVRVAPKSRMSLLLCTKCAIGWAIGDLFLHGVGIQTEWLITIGNLLFFFLAGGPDCVVITLSYAWLCGSVGFLAITSDKSYLYCNPEKHPGWEIHTAVTVLGILLTLVCISIRPVFVNWEVVTLPPLAATTLLACVTQAPVFLFADPIPGAFDVSFPASIPIVWASVYACGVLLQILSQTASSTRKIDLSDPSAGQNDLMRRLLADSEVTRTDLFESRFPIVQGMGAGNQPGDPFRAHINQPPVPSGSGGILERAQRENNGVLTENEEKILAICKEDEEQRNRILFGGGLW